jgi:hypothetical protein
MLLKTHREKMSDHGPLAMLMKINMLQCVSRDVHDKKGSYVDPWAGLVVGQIHLRRLSAAIWQGKLPATLPTAPSLFAALFLTWC